MAHPVGDCPICKNRFKADDDIVICPSCGAPYHRECYKKEGKCTFEAQHGANFEYVSPTRGNSATGQGEAAEGTQGEPVEGEHASGTKCPACDTINSSQNIFCENCGEPLGVKGPAAGNAGMGGGAFGGGMGGMGGMGGGMFGAAPTVDMKGQIDGIDKTDWASYVGSSAPFYVQRLSMMEKRGSKTSFMFSAFMVPHFYFAYRKMWGWAALSLIVSLVLSSVQMLALAAEMGHVLIPGIPVSTLSTISIVGSYAYLLVRLLFGLFAMHLYRLHARKKIKKMRDAIENRADYQDALAQKGGTSAIGPILVGVALVGYAVLSGMLLGNELMGYFATIW